jgi:hypothetical protein
LVGLGGAEGDCAGGEGGTVVTVSGGGGGVVSGQYVVYEVMVSVVT